MTNPYREHADYVQATIKRLSKEYLPVTAFEMRYAEDSGYLQNFVAVSGGQSFERDLDSAIMDMFKEIDGPPDAQSIQEV